MSGWANANNINCVIMLNRFHSRTEITGFCMRTRTALIFTATLTLWNSVKFCEPIQIKILTEMEFCIKLNDEIFKRRSGVVYVFSFFISLLNTRMIGGSTFLYWAFDNNIKCSRECENISDSGCGCVMNDYSIQSLS